MDDLISRQAALDALNEQIEYCNKALSSFDISAKDKYAVEAERASLKAYREQLENLPSAQPEIIRCKDCKWKQGSECVRFAEVRPFPDDFCSRAERRTDERPN